MIGPQKAVQKLHDRVLGQIAVHLDLLNDHRFLFNDIRISDARPSDHVGQDIKGLPNMLRGDLGVETGLFLGGEGIERPAEACSGSFDFPTRIFFTALKDDVFQEMGRTLEAVLFMPAADPNPEAQRDAAAISHVMGHNAQAVGQCGFGVHNYFPRKFCDNFWTNRVTLATSCFFPLFSAITLTIALPTITPSATFAIIFTCAGVDIPNPTQTGLRVRRLTSRICRVKRAGNSCRAPVTPVSET